MAEVLEGVRMGGLDPDKSELFGQVGGGNVARQLIRHHAAQYPPALTKALSVPRNEDRTPNLVLDEVRAAVRGVLPRGAVITGCAIHGADDAAQQFLSFTYAIEKGEGATRALWSGKAAVEYDPEELPRSHSRGSKAKGIREARESGLPWTPDDGVLDPEARRAGIPDSAEVDALREERDDLQNDLDDERTARETAESERDALRTQLAELSARVAAIEERDDDGPPAGTPEATVATAGTLEGGDVAPEPWPGYEAGKAPEIVAKVRELNDPDVARLVVAYEAANANRSTVLAAANQILDHTSG